MVAYIYFSNQSLNNNNRKIESIVIIADNKITLNLIMFFINKISDSPIDELSNSQIGFVFLYFNKNSIVHF